MTEPEHPDELPTGQEPEEVVPDYSRVGFRDLQKLCKGRGLPGDGKAPELIERLKAYDAQHGKDVDLTIPEDEDDPLGLDEADEPAAPAPPESPAGGGEAASAPPPPGYSHTLPEGGSVTSAAPAVVVYSDPAAPKGLPQSTTKGGKADLTVRDGLVKVGEGHGAAEVRAYRHEIPIGPRDVSDSDHFAYIADAHAAANRAGYVTKGGTTVGERVGYGHDADGRRTVIYQVPVKRQN